jgi:hypothetical protein
MKDLVLFLAFLGATASLGLEATGCKSKTPEPTGAGGAVAQPSKVHPIAAMKTRSVASPGAGTGMGGAGAIAAAARPDKAGSPQRKKRCDEVLKHVEALAAKMHPKQAEIIRAKHDEEVVYCAETIPDASLDCILKATTFQQAEGCKPAPM